MEKVTSKIYLVKDSHGNTYSAVCNESADTIQICGMRDVNNAPVYFESEGYHLDSFCWLHGIELKIVDRVEDFNTLWEKA